MSTRCKYCNIYSIGNLNDYNKSHSLGLEEKVQICRQCAIAIAFLHNMEPSIIHRDIKPGNILFKRVDQMDTVKIGDFGLAQSTDKTFMSTFGGSFHYIAPEMWPTDGERLQYTKAVDAYALGVVYFHVIKAKPGQELECPEGVFCITV